ncbi:hypothetical protein CHS0354_031096 [Potamilus streckersoni]|uniref:Uncharacterized protein n=1 Tax=Potamilus streckersoni TaxID=2493646 RepID=A0AAE0S2M4_9BIVA|nr:hypothetical protein CHS0354_031096 [Potamilus streckersoni]
MMNVRFLLRFTLGNYLIQNVLGLPVANDDVSTEFKENVTWTPKSSVVSSINCTFITENNDLPAEIDLQINEDTNVLVFKINFPGWSGKIQGLEQGNIYKPTHWVLARGHLGKGLLMLRHAYEMLSLFTLSLNTHKMNISLIQSSPNCMEEMNVSTFEIAVRELLLNNLKKNKQGDNICNIHIANDNGVAKFLYKCCHRNSDSTIKCKHLTRNVWLSMLFTIIFMLKLYVILASPRFIPNTFYGEKHLASTYIHRLGSKPIHLKIPLTKTPKLYQNARITTDVSRFLYMPRFIETLYVLKHDIVHNLTIQQIDIKIEGQRLIPEDDAPVGLLKSVYDSFLRCKIRERPSMSKADSLAQNSEQVNDVYRNADSHHALDFKGLFVLPV